ncbi:hypothetical protein LY78DRAFT_238095 [Colletotrichum sublineola]|nr:hypothetical protein LY78DRAFT_238095 [Colletotrichum sublineola]
MISGMLPLLSRLSPSERTPPGCCREVRSRNVKLFSRIRFLHDAWSRSEQQTRKVHREVPDIRGQDGRYRAPKPPFCPTLMIRAYLDSTPNGVLGLPGMKHRRPCPIALGLVPIPSCKPIRSVLNVRGPRPFNVLPRTYLWRHSVQMVQHWSRVNELQR